MFSCCFRPFFSQSDEHLSDPTLNCLSDESLISVSLRSLRRRYLALSFWNMLLHSSVLPGSVSVSTQRMKQPPLPVLTEASCRRQTVCFAPALGCLCACPSYYIFNGSRSWGCAKTCHCPKWEDLSSYIQAVWKLDPQAAAFKSMPERVPWEHKYTLQPLGYSKALRMDICVTRHGQNQSKHDASAGSVSWWTVDLGLKLWISQITINKYPSQRIKW